MPLVLLLSKMFLLTVLISILKISGEQITGKSVKRFAIVDEDKNGGYM